MNVFDLWNQIKKTLGTKNREVYVQERDVVFLKLGKNVGHEQDGAGDKFLRPVLVVKKFNNRLFWGVPLTSQNKNNPYHFALGTIKGKKNWAILSQGKTFDTARIQHKIARLDTTYFQAVKKAIAKVLDIA